MRVSGLEVILDRGYHNRKSRGLRRVVIWVKIPSQEKGNFGVETNGRYH